MCTDIKILEMGILWAFMFYRVTTLLESNSPCEKHSRKINKVKLEWFYPLGNMNLLRKLHISVL